ncbi:MAG: hypothetical protein ACTHU0_34420, partial [Kofleriaceae bacterium]
DPRLPPEIDALLMSALARDLKKRPTAGQFGAKLRSMRYALEVTVGDPATELAKIIETADEVQRESQQRLAEQLRTPSGPSQIDPFDVASTGGHRSVASRRGGFSSGFEIEHTEATVIRIRTADAFQMRDKDGGMARAREVLDRFEEEETRQSELSGDQLRILRARRDSGELAPMAPPPLPGMTRARRPTDEPTTTRPPVHVEHELDTPPNQRFDFDESTRLVARSRDRRTPAPQRVARPATQPPPMPGAASMSEPPTASARPGAGAGAGQPMPPMPLGAPPPTPPVPQAPAPLAPLQQPYPHGSAYPPPTGTAGPQSAHAGPSYGPQSAHAGAPGAPYGTSAPSYGTSAPSGAPYPSSGSSGAPYPSSGSSGAPYPSPGSSGAPYPSPGSSGTPYPAPGSSGAPYPSPGSSGSSGAPYAPSASSGAPYPSPGSSGAPYPSSASSGAPYPSPASSGAPYASSASSGAPNPSSGSSGAPYPSPRSSGAPYPSSGSSGAPYPSSGSSGASYPSPESSGAPYPSSGSSGAPYPSPGSSGAPYLSSGSSGAPYPSPGSSDPSYPPQSAQGYPAPHPSQPGYPMLPSQAASYAPWGVAPQLPPRAASPTAPDMFDPRARYPQRPSTPQVAGFQRARRPALQPWMLVVGALLMAALAFAITRAFLS